MFLQGGMWEWGLDSASLGRIESFGPVEYVRVFEIHKGERTSQQLNTQELFKDFFLLQILGLAASSWEKL